MLLPFGNSTETTAYVSGYCAYMLNYHDLFLIHTQISSNGLISFGTRYTSFIPTTFPISRRVIAPYWDDLDLRNKGSVKYATITSTHSALSHLLDFASGYVSSAEQIPFVGKMMLVARWVDVCPYQNNRCSSVSKLTTLL